MSRRERYSVEPIPNDANEFQDNVSFIHKFITNWLITDPSLRNPGLEKNVKAKNYQVQKHENVQFIYLCGGRLRSVKQKPINVVTGILILIPGILFWIFEAKWIWFHVNPSIVILFSYFWLITVSFFIKASMSDPGMLPRNIHVPYSISNANTSPKASPPDEYFNIISLPYNAEDHTGVGLKYCATCHIWRSPRASHCSVCNSCIISHDHHCVFLNNCIGYRNYKYFLWFLLFAVLGCILMSVISFIHVFYYRLGMETSVSTFRSSISKYPVSFFLCIYSLLALVYPFPLLIFHIFLTSYNLTTREYFNNVRGVKNLQNHFTNHFDTHSIFKNLYINWLGRARGFSLVRQTDSYQIGDLRFEKLDPLQSFSL